MYSEDRVSRVSWRAWCQDVRPLGASQIHKDPTETNSSHQTGICRVWRLVKHLQRQITTNVISRHFKDTVQFKPVMVQFIHNPIKSNSLKSKLVQFINCQQPTESNFSTIQSPVLSVHEATAFALESLMMWLIGVEKQ